MGQPDYTGDDGRTYRDPCTTKHGRRKKRWAREDAAWYVVDLAARGLYHVAKGQPIRLYAYRCPKCDGWHTASVRDEMTRRRHDDGLREWREKERK